MLHQYALCIKHKPKYKNGAYRRAYEKFTARSPMGAILQACDYCGEKNIRLVEIEIVKALPVNKEAEFKWLRKIRDYEYKAGKDIVDLI